MNKYKVEKMVPIAVEICNDDEHKGRIDDKTRNEFSAFGATIIMSGLLPAIAGFSKKKEKVKDETNQNETNTSIVNSLILAMLNKDKGSKASDLFSAVKEYDDKDKIKEDILNYVVSFKLALDALY